LINVDYSIRALIGVLILEPGFEKLSSLYPCRPRILRFNLFFGLSIILYLASHFDKCGPHFYLRRT